MSPFAAVKMDPRIFAASQPWAGRVVASLEIHTGNLDLVLGTLRKAAEKLAKRVPGVVVTATHAEDVANGTIERRLFCVEHAEWLCPHGRDAFAQPCRPVPGDRTFITVTVNGVAFDNGWQIIGLLTRDAGGAVIAQSFADDRPVTDADRARAGDCDHCDVNRARYVTFLVRRGDEVKAIGRSCMTEWTGQAVRADVLDLLTKLGERLAQLVADIDRKTDVAPTDVVIALAAKHAARHGYVSVANATTKNPATSWRVISDLSNGSKPPEFTPESLTAADLTAARKVIATLAADQRDGDEFYANLRAAVAAPHTQITGARTRVGLLAYASVAAQQAEAHAARVAEREAERAAREAASADLPDAHIGTVGKRQEFTGRITFIDQRDGDYGTYLIVAIETADGLVKLIGGCSGLDHEIHKGAQVTFAATVKRHGEHEGRKETQVQRLTVKKIEVAAPVA